MKKAFTLIIPAAGDGLRLGAGTAKAFVDLEGEPILSRTMTRFDGIARIAQRVVAVRPEDIDIARSCLERWDVDVVEGGRLRQDSVRAALAVVESNYVAVHDAARPFPARDMVEAVLDETVKHGAAIAAIPVTDTTKQTENGFVARTISRDGLWAAQTPQAFRTDLLRNAFGALSDSEEVTDCAQLLEALDIPVRIVEAGRDNMKITMPEDLEVARQILRKGP